MPTPIKIPFTTHFDFSALPLIQVRESFARIENGVRRVYAGVQHGKWHGDEYVWSERAGRWSNFTPEPKEETFALEAGLELRTVANDLMIAGALVEEFALSIGNGETEPLLRAVSGASLVATAGVLYEHPGQTMDYIPAKATAWLLFNCASGVLTANAGQSGALGVVADGSYVLWASANNEYSAIRLVVGNGPWTWNEAHYPGPGCPLFRKSADDGEIVLTDANRLDFTVPFDPLARVVSASCVLHSDIRTRSGQFDLPAGSLIIGGIRASRGGPQSALWALHSDGSARLLACSPTFSDGACECAKTNHFASDIAQHPDGRLFVLSECDCTVYDPDAPTIWERLKPFPATSGETRASGHLGGQTIRFPDGEVCFWTENFGGVNDGTPHYNRLVRRVSGRDVSGPSTLWHGTNCAEMFLGRYWAIRCDEDTDTLKEKGGTLYLDWIDNGRWHGFAGMKRDTKHTFWQRLRARGNTLFLFGYSPSDPVGAETPVCAVADGVTLRDAAFPFFVRRATPSNGSLFVCARSELDGIGAANRVVEITRGKTHICSFWNESDHAFEMSRLEFAVLGGDPAKLSTFFSWQVMSGANGGGKWRMASQVPTSGFHLQTVTTETTIRFEAKPNGALPFDPAHWSRLCFDILSDGSVDGPFIEPTCKNAQCVIDSMPNGTKFRVLQRPVSDAVNPLTSLQITDASESGRLALERDLAPTLWARVDSTLPLNDLASYTQLVNYGRMEVLDEAAKTCVDVVVLVAPQNQPLPPEQWPILSRRT